MFNIKVASFQNFPPWKRKLHVQKWTQSLNLKDFGKEPTQGWLKKFYFSSYFQTQLKRVGVPKQDLALFYVSCMRSVTNYAAPVFLKYLKKELVWLKKRAISIITSGKCNSALEVGLTPILEHYYVLCSRLFDNIVSDPNHKLKVLLRPDHDNSSIT